MNFQQLRFVREALRRDFNFTEVGNALFISQSGVSKRIRELELELGVDIFLRKGKRIIGLTPAGQDIATSAERILAEVDTLRRHARRHGAQAPSRNPAAETAWQ